MADQDKPSSNPDPVKPASQDQVVNTPSDTPTTPTTPVTPGASKSPAKPASPPATLKGLSNRLKIKSKMVRKIAIMDLIKQHAEFGTNEVVEVLAAHLAREDQPALQLRILDFLVDNGGAASLPLLQKLAADEATDETLTVSLHEVIAIIQKES